MVQYEVADCSVGYIVEDATCHHTEHRTATRCPCRIKFRSVLLQPSVVFSCCYSKQRAYRLLDKDHEKMPQIGNLPITHFHSTSEYVVQPNVSLGYILEGEFADKAFQLLVVHWEVRQQLGNL